jgi:hypothetical protein
MFGAVVAVASMGLLGCAYIWVPYQMAKAIVKDVNGVKTVKMSLDEFVKKG